MPAFGGLVRLWRVWGLINPAKNSYFLKCSKVLLVEIEKKAVQNYVLPLEVVWLLVFPRMAKELNRALTPVATLLGKQ